MSYTKPLLVGHQLFTVNSLSRECKLTPKVSQRSDIYVCFSFTFLCLVTLSISEQAVKCIIHECKQSVKSIQMTPHSKSTDGLGGE